MTGLSFQQTLHACAADVEALLDTLLGQGAFRSTRMAAAMRYATLGPGKRLRPFLAVESARLFEVPRERALRVGAAVECVHCYSLVHDDLPAMDDDDLRRGKPTVHRAFDEATAILAGDGLLTFAFQILADPATHPDPVIRLELVASLSAAAGAAGMVAGQMLDMEAETQSGSSLYDITLIQSMKTGALFRFSCESGAVLAGADTAPLRSFADCIGLAFQIADDILDVESTPEALGKATQKDRGKGKATFVDLMGLEAARHKAREKAEEAVAALSPYGSRASVLREAARFMVERQA